MEIRDYIEFLKKNPQEEGLKLVRDVLNKFEENKKARKEK
jgi:hypothetical protein